MLIRMTARSETTSETAIDLFGVNVNFDGRAVLNDVNLRVARGEFIAVIGPSGGGKSTLLRVIAGLLNSSGVVSVTGDDHRGRAAVVFQDYRLLPWRTTRQNVALPRELTGRGASDPDAVLKQVGMLEYATLYPHQLSGGMRARVAIARALAQDAEVILFDEPFAALDALVRERFNLEMKRLHNKTGKTIIFITHSIREAVYLADRVVVLREGRIETILDTHGEGRLSAFTDGLEAELRSRLGMPDSTFIEPPVKPLRFPWEVLGVLSILSGLLIGWTLLAAKVPLGLPTPLEVGHALIDKAPLLVAGTLETLRIASLGLLVSLAVGLPLGYAFAKSKTLERLLSPFVVALQAVPTVVIAPLLVFIPGFGFGTSSRVLITSLISIFPLLVSTMIGVREVDRVYREVFTTIGSGFWGVFSKLEFPGALPVILSGLRSTVALSLIGTVVSEFALQVESGRSGGLGHIVNSARNNFQYSTAYAAVTILVVIGCTFYGLITLLERAVLRYRKR
jgi:NitT/TauT family transport system ATP-binding protein